MSRSRWMALCFALGSTYFLIGPFPGYAQLVGDSADAVTFFIGSILFTAGGGLQSWLAWSERHSPVAEVRRGGQRSSNPPARCSSTSRRTKRCTPPCRAPSTTSSSGGPIGAGQSASSCLARLPTARLRASWMVAGARRRGMVAAGSQPARLRLLRNLRCRRLCRSVDRVDARPGGGQLEHIAGRGVLPGLRARHLAHR
jgi:hypothetical protein